MINHVFDEEVEKILLLVQQSSKCMYMPYQACTWGRRKVQKKRNSSSIRAKTGTQSQRHALGLSLTVFIDTHHDDGYVDSMNCASRQAQ